MSDDTTARLLAAAQALCDAVDTEPVERTAMSDANRPPLGSREAFRDWLWSLDGPTDPVECDLSAVGVSALYAAFVELAADAERLDWLTRVEWIAAYGNIDGRYIECMPMMNRATIDAARAATETPDAEA